MTTVSTSFFTNDNLNLADPGNTVFSGNLTAQSNLFKWDAGLQQQNEITILGSGFTYSGSGDARELASGTISKILIDRGDDNGFLSSGDIVIRDTEGLNAAAIRKDSIQGFWGEILKGDDKFNLAGMGEANIGVRTGLFFGDDYSGSSSRLNPIDTGGNDVMLGADNDLTLIGDVYRIDGFTIKTVQFSSVYFGGNDKITSAISDRKMEMSGDADNVFAHGVLHGGNDRLDNGRNTNLSSFVAGDAHFVFSFSTTFGGNDDILLGLSGIGSGDVLSLSGSGNFVEGGDDVIGVSGNGKLSCAGDVLAIGANADNTTIIGGNDRIIGGSLDDRAAGEVLIRQSAQGVVSITGGDDLMTGGDGNDTFWGEVNFALTGVSGGNDDLRGDNGDDQLFGQTGNDSLAGGNNDDRLMGGSGDDLLVGGDGADTLNGGGNNDRLRGGTGIDMFFFASASGIDRILDFVDTGGAEDDIIDLRLYDFANLGAIGRSASGDDLVLSLGGGNQIIVVNYLETHAGNAINDDIVI